MLNYSNIDKVDNEDSFIINKERKKERKGRGGRRVEKVRTKSF